MPIVSNSEPLQTNYIHLLPPLILHLQQYIRYTSSKGVGFKKKSNGYNYYFFIVIYGESFTILVLHTNLWLKINGNYLFS
jgi:hypothetical protein